MPQAKSTAQLRCPHCGGSIPRALQRQVSSSIGALGGRPRTAKRCPCGAMTLARAKARYHKCS